jgi:hypothetical protein
MRQPAQPIAGAAWGTFKVQPEPFNESERVCRHHGLSRERIIISPVLDCDVCFFGLLQTISLELPRRPTTGGGVCLFACR